MPFTPPRLFADARAALLTITLSLGLSMAAQAQVRLDVPYVPTPYDAVHRMLEVADVRPDDKLIDLGSGDGRIVVQAARDWGVSGAIGIDIDPRRVAEAQENARKAGVDDRVEFIQGDLFQLDFSQATVLTMYLLESLNIRLQPVILDTLKPGTRVVSHVFSMGDWKPDVALHARGLPIYLWIVPAKVAGTWRIEHADGHTQEIELYQQFQRIEGTYRADEANHHTLNFAELRGDHIRLSAAGKHYIGRVEGDTIVGLPGPGVVVNWRATRM